MVKRIYFWAKYFRVTKNPKKYNLFSFFHRKLITPAESERYCADTMGMNIGRNSYLNQD